MLWKDSSLILVSWSWLAAVASVVSKSHISCVELDTKRQFKQANKNEKNNQTNNDKQRIKTTSVGIRN